MIAKVWVLVVVGCGLAVGQGPVAQSSGTAQGKRLAFEVVSIRPSKPGSDWGGVEVLPDEYRATRIGLWVTVERAYVPLGPYAPDLLRGIQPWMTNDKYDIEAKVSAADVADWQKQGRDERMLRAMLQTLLAERCKLVVHKTPAEIDGLALMVGKHGAKMSEAKPGEIFPAGMIAFPDGGGDVGYRRGQEKGRITYYGTSMASFAASLTGMSYGHPVRDKTGLMGHYDFVLAWSDLNPDTGGTEGMVSLSDADPLSHWNFGALGLRVVPLKIPAETVVIDHVERPSAN